MDDQAEGPDRSRAAAGPPVVALRCPCGLELVGATEDELVTVAQEHLSTTHPRLAGSYDREDVLSLSYRRPPSRK